MAGRLASVACLLAATVLLCSTGGHAAGDFVKVDGLKFTTDSCPTFVFSGYNSWQPIEVAAGLLGGKTTVNEQFDTAVANSLTVVRMFGFSVQQGINNQYGNGAYNESMLVAFDNVIAAASSKNLKLIIALANNWNYNGNMSDCKDWYTNQSTTATGPDDFFADAGARAAYLANAKYIMGRNNTVTGLAYNADPTIMAWDLINEGRCEENCTAADIQDWINYVAPLVKSYAPNQLLTVGEDGWFQADNCQANTVNPVNNTAMPPWPLKTGQDWLPNHAVDGIDFGAIHMWPDNWARTDLDFGKAWINAHMSQSKVLGKPLILEEFGKNGTKPDPAGGPGLVSLEQEQYDYYKLAYAITEGSINTGGALAGIAFWRWAAIDNSTQLEGDDQAATISTSSRVYTEIIQPFSQRVQKTCPTSTGTNTSSGVLDVAGRRLLQTNNPLPQAITAPVAAPMAAGSKALISNSAVTDCSYNTYVPQ